MGPTEVACITQSESARSFQSPRSSPDMDAHTGHCQPRPGLLTKLSPTESTTRAFPQGRSAQKQLSSPTCSSISVQDWDVDSATTSRMMATEKATTTYASITPVVLTEFVPSRATRPSQNAALQEHISDGRTVIQQRGLFPGRVARNHRPEPKVQALPGEYAKIDFVWNSNRPRDEAPVTSLGFNDILSSGAKPGSHSSSSASDVYGLEKSCEYENLCRPRNNVQASVWLGQRHAMQQGRSSPPTSSSSGHHRSAQQHEPRKTSPTHSREEPSLIVEESPSVGESHSDSGNASPKSSHELGGEVAGEQPEGVSLQDGYRSCRKSSLTSSSSGHPVLRTHLSANADLRAPAAAGGRDHPPVTSTGSLNSESPRGKPFLRRMTASRYSPDRRQTSPNSPVPPGPGPVYQNSPNAHFRSPSAPVEFTTRNASAGRDGRTGGSVSDLRARSNSTSSNDTADVAPELPVRPRDAYRRSTGESPDYESKCDASGAPPALPPRLSRSVSPPQPGHSPDSSELVIESVPSTSTGQWRQSTADELFASFSLSYVGSELVEKGYGVVVSTMERVVQAGRGAQLCTMNVTAAAVQVKLVSLTLCSTHVLQNLKTYKIPNAHGRPPKARGEVLFSVRYSLYKVSMWGGVAVI